MNFYEIINKINNIEECRLKSKNTKYTASTINAYSKDNQIYDVYIIY